MSDANYIDIRIRYFILSTIYDYMLIILLISLRLLLTR